MQKFIKKYKQMTGYHIKKEYKIKLWQENYYEHILRKNEEHQKIGYYILNNPVRKNIVNDYRDYKYSGSFEFELDKIL